MVNCSTLKKDTCSTEASCKWEVGKGCRSVKGKAPAKPKSPAKPKAAAAKPKAAPAPKAKAPVKKASSKSLESQVIVFSGFRDTDLVDQIVKAGGRVTLATSKQTTMVVAKDTLKDTSTIKFARENNIKLMSKDAFVSTFGLKAAAVKAAPAKAKADKKAKDTEPKVKAQKKATSVARPSVPPEMSGSDMSSLPMNIVRAEFEKQLGDRKKIDLTFKGKSVHEIYRQAKHIVKGMMEKMETGKPVKPVEKHWWGTKYGRERKPDTIKVYEVANFLGYSFEDDCFLFIMKIQTLKRATANASTKIASGTYDLVIGEIKYEADKNGTGKPGYNFLGFRPMVDAIPPREDVNIVEVIEKQYGKDLFVIFKSEGRHFDSMKKKSFY